MEGPVNKSRRDGRITARRILMFLVPAAALGLAQIAPAQSPTPDEKWEVPFSVAWDSGYGNEVFVVGNHPDLGEWNPVAAQKLRWTAGNVWTAKVAISAGAEIEYKYVVRTNAGEAYCRADNVVWAPGDNVVSIVPVREGDPHAGKTVYYRSSWTNARLLYRSGSRPDWADVPMERIGEGRFTGESTYRATGIGAAGERLTFVPHGYAAGEESWDHCPIEGIDDYHTRLDVFFLQDGHISNYWPPDVQEGASISTHYVESSRQPQIPSRNVRVYLPRNYAWNATKRYPVLYMHDGQNVFRPGGVYGCWNVEDAADDMIRLGTMGETIIVAVDNTDRRLSEYLPPTDSYDGAGTANLYLEFLAHDVKPFVDGAFRTLPGREHTGVLGSSFGGIASLYCGMASNVFGKIGAMSSSFWAIPNFMAEYVEAGAEPGFWIYMDCGTDESEEDAFAPMWRAYDHLLADGYVPNDDIKIEVGCGHTHSEWAWALRIPDALAFLFNCRDEPNELQHVAHPLRVEVGDLAGGAQVGYTGYKGWEYVLERAERLEDPLWVGVATGEVSGAMWAGERLADETRTGGRRPAYRVSGKATNR